MALGWNTRQNGKRELKNDKIILRGDLHVHTIFSLDTFNPLELLIRFTRKVNLDFVAVTDHNCIEGAFKLQGMAPFEVIIGEEIQTREGEIIGLFLDNFISPGLSPEETIQKIRAQDGIVYLPHPFSTKRGSKFSKERLQQLANQVDIVEVFNARNLDPKANERAKEYTSDYGLLFGAGSDAHSTFEVGNAYIEMDEFNSKDEFLRNLERGKIKGRRTPPYVRLVMNRFVRKSLRRLFA